MKHTEPSVLLSEKEVREEKGRRNWGKEERGKTQREDDLNQMTIAPSPKLTTRAWGDRSEFDKS